MLVVICTVCGSLYMLVGLRLHSVRIVKVCLSYEPRLLMLTNSTQIQIVDNHDRGILDLKFHGNTIITATSIGTIDIYELQPPAPGSQASFQLRSKIRVADHTTVITSVALDISSNGEKQIAFTASDGRVGLVILPSDLLGQVNSPSSTVIEPRERNIPNVTTHVQRLPERHTLEAWITAFSPTSWNPRSIFSGGDDATLMSHVEHTPGEWTPGLRDRKTHGAGVTALLPLQLSGELSSERLLLTGSYDDRLRVLDLGSARGTTLRRPTVVRELDLGGGVWRIKVLGQSQDDVDGRSTVKLTLAVACMYAGAFVVEVSLVKECDEVWVCELDIMQHMEEHESMCYGVDARPSRSGTAHSLVSCSFYDKRLCLWQWPPRVN